MLKMEEEEEEEEEEEVSEGCRLMRNVPWSVLGLFSSFKPAVLSWRPGMETRVLGVERVGGLLEEEFRRPIRTWVVGDRAVGGLFDDEEEKEEGRSGGV